MIAFLTPRTWKLAFWYLSNGKSRPSARICFPRSDSNLGFLKTTNNLPPRHISPRCDATLLAKSPMCLRSREQKAGDFKSSISGIVCSLDLRAVRLPPPRLPPHSNNCPPPPRKSPEPLENSITGLHERFKIMVLSLCEERERTWPPAAARRWRSVARAWVGGATHRGSRWGFFVFVLFFCASSLQRWKPDGGAEARAREAADIPCKAVYQWPVGRTLGAAQHA